MTETDGRTVGRPDGQPDGRAAKKSSLLRFLPLGVVVVAVVAVFMFGMDDFLSFEMVKANRQAALDWYGQNRILAIFYFVFGYALVVALSVPGAMWLSLAGGFLFGTVLATLYVVLAATLGAVGIFLIARYALADFFHEKMGAAGRRMEKGFRENALSYLLVLRLVPLFPFWLVNLMPALLGVPVRTFVIGTFFGVIPGSAVFCSIGNGLGLVIDKGEMPKLDIIFEPHIFGPLLGLAALALVPVAYKRIKASKEEAG
ncbi:MAG: TVP38/TMEM64 family protein [Proteobacteria bacterium]|nr:TVP38/TMEM64 family protein [Pseudomonadota bacterium]